MKYVLYFTKQLYAYSGNQLMINILGMVLISLLEGAGVLMLLPVISASGLVNVDAGISPVSGILQFLKEFPQALGLPIILGIFVSLVIGQNLLQRYLLLRDTAVQQQFVRRLRIETYTSLLQSNWGFFVRHRKSDLLHLMTNELTRVGFGTTLVLQLIASLIFTVIQIGLAFWLAPVMTVSVLSFGILLLFLSRKFIRKAKSIGTQTSQLSQQFLAGITDQLNGIKDIKSNTLEESRLIWLRSLTEQMVGEQLAYIKLRSSSQLFYKASSALLLAAFILLSVFWFQAKVEQLLLIFAIFSRLWPRFIGIQTNLEQIASAIPAFKAIRQLQEECKGITEFRVEDDQAYKKAERIEVRQEIECRQVSFRYDQDEQVYALQGIDLHIPSNRTTAIVGRSGAGKSTLIDIIMGLIQPETGEVLIDGQPLHRDKLVSLRQSISYVPQEPFLFHASIRENMYMMEPGATEEQMWEALEFAASAEFVRRLPQGLDTLIGDRGIRLSGGERQRLVLARGILRRPSILILDEATSALDTENEAKIQAAIDRLKGAMTIIVIAHRLSTIRNADQVIVLDQGRVIQKGQFSQLAREEGSVFSHLIGEDQTLYVKVV